MKPIQLIFFLLFLLPLSAFAEEKMDTLYAGAMNILPKPKEAKGMKCFLMYEGEDPKVMHESMASFVDLGKKIFISPPAAGILWIIYGENDSMFVSRQKYTVLDIPKPKIEVSAEGAEFAKSTAKIFRGQKVKISFDMPKEMNIADKRFRASDVKLAYFKDFSQNTPTKVDDISPSGSGKCIELNTQHINLKGFSVIKIQIGKLFRQAYNNKESEVDLPKYALSFTIYIKDDTIPLKPISPPKTVPKPAVAPVITRNDIVYYTDGSTPLPPSDVRKIVDREPTSMNIDSVMRNVNFAVLQKTVGGDNNLKVKLLINEKGHYENHLILKEANPVTTSRVCAFLPFLRFIPAQRAGKPVKYWLELPIVLR